MRRVLKCILASLYLFLSNATRDGVPNKSEVASHALNLPTGEPTRPRKRQQPAQAILAEAPNPAEDEWVEPGYVAELAAEPEVTEKTKQFLSDGPPSNGAGGTRESKAALTLQGHGAGGSSTSHPPSVWIFNKNGGVFTPIIYSLKDAFVMDGCRVEIASPNLTSTMKREIAQNSRSGLASIVIVIGVWWHEYDLEYQFLQQSTQLGVYLILYQTEPLKRTDCAGVLGHMRASNASELWDYSRANMDVCSSSFAIPFPLRYMPPGYTRYFDYGVDVDSPLQNPSMIGFVGYLEYRKPEVVQQYSQVLGKSLVATHDVWGREAWKDFLTQYPVQLNMHKDQKVTGSSTTPMEAFRMALLLANKACVISAPSHPSDAWKWRDVVKFANAGDTMDTLKSVSEHVRDCRLIAYNTYKQKFSSLRLLRESGFNAHNIKDMRSQDFMRSTWAHIWWNRWDSAPLTAEDEGIAFLASLLANLSEPFWAVLCLLGLTCVSWSISKVTARGNKQQEYLTMCQALPLALLWMTFGVALILFNKCIFLKPGSGFGFPRPVFLMWFQMLWCTVFTNTVRFMWPGVMPAFEVGNLGFFSYFRSFLPISCLQAGALALGNIAYLYISVSLIQMVKNTTTAFVYIFSTILGLEKVSTSKALAVAIAISGMMISVGNIHMAAFGFILQMSSTFSDALRLCLTKAIMTTKHSVKLDPMSALCLSSSIIFLLLSLPMYFIDLHRITFAELWGLKFVLCANAMLALCLNMTSMLFMSRVGATTYALTGILKDIFLVLFLLVLFGHNAWLQAIGFGLTVAGTLLYNSS